MGGGVCQPWRTVDSVMKYGLGMRYACLGPLETVDFGGIDVFTMWQLSLR